MFKGIEKLQSSADFEMNKIGAGHTFGYKDLHYKVSDLVYWVEKVESVKVKTIPTPLDFLKSTEPNLMWGEYDAKSKEITPMTMFKMVEHIDRILKADLHYPVILLQTPTKYRSLDGLHRIMKAALNKIVTIQARILTETDMVKFVAWSQSKDKR